MPASDSASPATKALAKAKVAHVLHSYDHDPSNHHFGDEGAAKLGFDPDIMLKTSRPSHPRWVRKKPPWPTPRQLSAQRGTSSGGFRHLDRKSGCPRASMNR